MNYVITNGTLYIGSKGGACKQNEAKIFATKKAADNFFKSSISKPLRNLNFKVEETELEPPGSNINAQYFDVDVNALQTDINNLSAKLNVLKGNKAWLLDMESEVDKEICDIMHFIEFNNFSASDGYKLCKALKDLRLRRRKIKNELELINIINTQSLNNVASGQTNKAIDSLDNKKYAPRVLQELFEYKDINSIINKIDVSEQD